MNDVLIRRNRMGIGVSLLLIAAGAILVWGVTGELAGVDVDAIGVILMIVGGIGLVLSMVFWSSWGGPGYFGRRRETYVEEGPPPA
jgi:hypothetical protein